MLVCNVSEYISRLRSAKREREREMTDDDASSQNEVQMQEV